MLLKIIGKQLLFISRMPKLCVILQLVSSPYNPLVKNLLNQGSCGLRANKFKTFYRLFNAVSKKI